jgi:hypothetical protein
MQQEFIYELIILVTHDQLELGYNKELGSAPPSSCAHEAWGGPWARSIRTCHAQSQKADGSSEQEMPVLEFVLAPEI